MQAACSFTMPWLQQANADAGKCFEDTRLEWPKARFTAAARTQGSTPSSTNWLSRVNDETAACLLAARVSLSFASISPHQICSVPLLTCVDLRVVSAAKDLSL